MLAIWKREVQAYFYQPIAYVLIGLFFLISSIYFTMGTVASGYAEINYLLQNIIFIFTFIIPILTMRILTEDRKMAQRFYWSHLLQHYPDCFG